jgi:hypothetical protein
MTWDLPAWVCDGEGGGLGCEREGAIGGVEEVMRRWRSLISSSAVSVYRGADLTTLRATCRFILITYLTNNRNGQRTDKLLVLSQPYC